MNQEFSRVLWLAVILCLGCEKKPSASEEAKKSPSELITLLGKNGLKIEKAGSFENQPPAEMNMELKVDGQDDIVAKRFPTTKLASDYCETQQACFTIEHWAIEAFVTAARSRQWQQLLANVGKAPSPTLPSSIPAPAGASPACATLDKCCASGSPPQTVEVACMAAKSGGGYSDCAQNLRAVQGLFRAAAKPIPSGCE